MFFNEHGVPHVHARRGGYSRRGKGGGGIESAAFSVETGEMLEGELSPQDAAMVTAWILLRKKELREDVALIAKGQKVKRIDPLR